MSHFRIRSSLIGSNLGISIYRHLLSLTVVYHHFTRALFLRPFRSPSFYSFRSQQSLTQLMMEDHIALIGKSILFGQQIRRENGSLHSRQERQATTIEIFRAKHEEQASTIEALKEQVTAGQNAHAQLKARIDDFASDLARSSQTQAAVFQLVTDLNNAGLATSIQALSQQNETITENVKGVTTLVVEMQLKQTKHEQDLESLARRVAEMQPCKDKSERDLWGLGNRLTNLNTECNEMREETHLVKTAMAKLDEYVIQCQRESEQAIAIARSVQQGQVKLIDEVEKLERSILNRTSTLTSEMSRLEPHYALDVSSAQVSRHPSGTAANSKVLRTHRQDPQFERATTVDSQATMSHIEDEDDIPPSSPPIARPEPASIIQQKAKTLATPFLTPGRQLRSQARGTTDTLRQSTTKPPFAASIPPASAQTETAMSQRVLTRSQAQLSLPLTEGVVDTPTPEPGSSSVPSMSSLLADAANQLTQGNPLLGTTSKIEIGTTPSPNSFKAMPPASKKRKLDDTMLGMAKPKTTAAIVQDDSLGPPPGPPRISDKPVMMGRNGKPVIKTTPYRQNRRYEIDDW